MRDTGKGMKSGYLAVAATTALATLAAAPSLLATDAPAPSAGPHDISPPACSWQPLPVELPARYQAAGVYDPSHDHFYYYGGLDREDEVSADVHYIDLADDDLALAHVEPAPIDGLQPEPRWGHAGVFRPSRDGVEDPSILWIGGQRGDSCEPEPTPVRTMSPRTPSPCPTAT